MNKMATSIRLLLASVVAALLISGVVPVAADTLFNNCDEIETVQDFDIDEYTRLTWYIQRQQETAYQLANSLFCVTATYNTGAKQYFKDAIAVSNFGNEGSVNGEVNSASLCATRKYKNKDPAKLGVAPCSLPPSFAGPYWVAAVGTSGANYTWAIVLGGQPNVEGECADDESLCTTKKPGDSPLDSLNFGGTGQGLWFLTRDQIPEASLISEIEATAASLGICTANMLDVVHEGCTYAGSNHKTE